MLSCIWKYNYAIPIKLHKKTQPLKMHILQPKHFKIKTEEAKKILEELNISLAQLPKIKAEDPGLKGEKVVAGDLIKIERKFGDKSVPYYRVVI